MSAAKQPSEETWTPCFEINTLRRSGRLRNALRLRLGHSRGFPDWSMFWSLRDVWHRRFCFGCAFGH